MLCRNASWIWENNAPQPDEYADFLSVFRYQGGKAELEISCDSNYAAFVNGKLAAFGQYADYPHYKVADTIDISAFCHEGENTLLITVWYYGDNSSVYTVGQAGVIYEVVTDGVSVAHSGPAVLCRVSPCYVPHRCKKITGQLGFSFWYDAAASDTAWHPACLTGYTAELHPRPIRSLRLDPLREGKIIREENGMHFLLDVGCEEVGFLSLDLDSPCAQKITIAYGEHIADGCVRAAIGGRDFTVEYGAAAGHNVYMNPFRRLGARYLEIFCEKPITLYAAGLCPTMYPVEEIPYTAQTERQQQIYDVSVRTLRLCMHEHYEDCPWREQALYAMDSRNQIVSGYYAFGEQEFPRANLMLMAQDRREDGLLSITYPCGVDCAIPSFSLHWFTEMLEYTEFTGDTTLVCECWEKMNSVLRVFLDRVDNGVVNSFSDMAHWNYYEWSDGLSGKLGRGVLSRPELPLMCLTVRAIEAMQTLSEMTGMPFAAGSVADEIRAAIRRLFFLPDEGVFTDFTEEHHISELGCSLAILAGAATQEECRVLAEKLTAPDRDMVPITLSMKCFLYDALLMTDREKYKETVLADIELVYGKMLDAGATSFWETEEGESAFGNAGSLCHGWSAMPVYYYWTLLG